MNWKLELRKVEQPKQPIGKFTHRPSTVGSWPPGQSGNAKGRPKGATRQTLAAHMIPDIVQKWETHGAAVLEHLATNEPKAFAQIAASLLPREVAVSIEQRLPGNLDPESWATLRRVLDAIAKAQLAGADPGELFAAIENFLRSEYARPIEHAPAGRAGPALPLQIEAEPNLAPPPY